MKYFIIFFIFFSLTLTHEQPIAFLQALNSEAYEWIGIKKDKFSMALDYCKFEEFEHQLMHFIQKLEHANQNFTIQTLDIVEKTFRNDKIFRQNIKCFVSFSNTKVHFLEEKKKLSTIKQYINKYPQYSEKVFHENYTAEHKGKQLGKWIKGFMQYYYIHYVSESQTLSTVLLRSLSTKVQVLKNRDFSFCIDLQDAGKLSEQLQNMDINNIFLKVPAAFNVLKYLHLKQKCQNPQNNQIVKNLQNKIKDIDMFKLMYYQYQPYVTIATQKYGISKIKLLATCFSKIINNSQQVRKQLMIKLQEQQRQKNQKDGKQNKDGQL